MIVSRPAGQKNASTGRHDALQVSLQLPIRGDRSRPPTCRQMTSPFLTEGRFAVPPNYYVILGVGRNADPIQIKRAYRDAIKQSHPDVIGSECDPDRFRRVRQAYETLSDAEKRSAHDAELDWERIPVRKAPNEPPAGFQRRFGPYPWRPASPVVDTGSRDRRSSGYRFFKDRSEPPGSLHLKIVLTPEEGLRGERFPVTVVVPLPCPECGSGWFRFGGHFCRICRGSGFVEIPLEMIVDIPPRTRDGTITRVRLDGVGLRGVQITIDVSVF